MKKSLIALSIFAFLGSTAVASVVAFQNNTTKTEIADGGKDKKKKKKCKEDCAKDCCAKTDKAAASCTKSAEGKSCCSKKKADTEKSDK